MNRPLSIAILLLALSSTTMAGGLFAKQKPRDTNGNTLPTDDFVPAGRVTPDEQKGGISQQQAARQAQSINRGGRVLSVDAADGGWRVKLLKDGNVRIVVVPR